MEVVSRHQSVIPVFGNALHGVDPNDSRAGIPVWIPTGQLEFNVDVRSTIIAAKIRVHGVDCAVNLGIGQVVLHTHGFSEVEDVDHDRQGVFRARAEGSRGHVTQGGFHGKEAPGIGCVLSQSRLENGLGRTSIALRGCGAPRGHEKQEEQGCGETARGGHEDGDLIPLLQASSSGCIFPL